MNTSKNDITGDELKSKTNNDKYRDGWDRIFGKKDQGEVLKELGKDLDAEIFVPSQNNAPLT
jgi:hypothetical protein